MEQLRQDVTKYIIIITNLVFVPSKSVIHYFQCGFYHSKNNYICSVNSDTKVKFSVQGKSQITTNTLQQNQSNKPNAKLDLVKWATRK